MRSAKTICSRERRTGLVAPCCVPLERRISRYACGGRQLMAGAPYKPCGRLCGDVADRVVEAGYLATIIRGVHTLPICGVPPAVVTVDVAPAPVEIGQPGAAVGATGRVDHVDDGAV